MRAVSPLLLFFALVVLLCGLIDGMIIVLGFSGVLVAAAMWSVGLSAMLALKLTGRSLFELGWGWGPTKYHVIAIAIPIIYSALGYAAAAASGQAEFLRPGRIAAFAHAGPFAHLADPLPLIGMLAILVTVGMLRSMMTALGEEIGWRGFLAPRLIAARGFVVGTLITGFLWALWHTPIIVGSGYNGGGDIRFELLSFFVGVVSMSAVLSWLRLRSGSLWPCATMHASHNLFIQDVFDPLSSRGPSHVTMVGEFGIVFAAAVLVVSIPFWITGARSAQQA
jgi:membrane protease YdiL (CAAX protease family)